MRNPSENRVLKYNSRFLGTAIFLFGFLKFFDPFHAWFRIQIAKSGLPPLAIPLGMAAEMSIGLGLLLGSTFRQRIKNLYTPIVASASAGLIVNMAVAIYVHLQPDVPANVLPLGIRPPFIPLAFMLLAGLNLFQLLRTNGNAPSVVGRSLSSATTTLRR